MRLKLDENLGTRGRAILVAAGHDACTVADQALTSYEDRAIIERCKAKSRCLVTLDLDYANPLVFQPSLYPGIAVLRAPPHPTLADLERLVRNLAECIAARFDHRKIVDRGDLPHSSLPGEAVGLRVAGGGKEM